MVGLLKNEKQTSEQKNSKQTNKNNKSKIDKEALGDWHLNSLVKQLA